MLTERDGAGTITQLRVEVPGLASLSSADEQKALRLLTIRITWDGDENPAVWATPG